VRGESYKVGVYEDAIGLALGHVAVSARLKAAAVAEAVRPEPGGSDVMAQARIRREREQAALRFAKDRDLGRLEAAMARLDAEAEAAVQRPSCIPTAAEARAYLESLPDLWAKTSDAGRHAIAEAVFERIDVLGMTDFTFTLTAAAKARGWDAAFGPGVIRLHAQCGRGKTSSPRPASGEGVLSTKEGQSGRGERICAAMSDAGAVVRFVREGRTEVAVRSA